VATAVAAVVSTAVVHLATSIGPAIVLYQRPISSSSSANVASLFMHTCCYTLQGLGRQLFDGDASDDAAITALASVQAAAGGSSSSSGGMLYQKLPQRVQNQQHPVVTDDDCRTGDDDIGGAVYSKVGSSVLTIQQTIMIAALVAYCNTCSQFC
jgi:hypothetical protein